MWRREGCGGGREGGRDVEGGGREGGRDVEGGGREGGRDGCRVGELSLIERDGNTKGLT